MTAAASTEDDPPPHSHFTAASEGRDGPDSTALVARLTESIGRSSPGFQRAATALVEKYRPHILAYIERRLGPGLRRRLEPDDILCEALMRAFKDLDHFTERRPRAFLHWIMLQARRAILDHARRNAGGDLLFEGDASDPERKLEPANSTVGPVKRLYGKELRRAILDALEEVPDLYRGLLRDFYILEIPRLEIAAKLGRLPNTVTHQLKRGVEHWRRAIETRLGPGSAGVFFDL